MRTEVITAHVSVTERSAVEDLKNPVRPIREPQMEERKIVAI